MSVMIKVEIASSVAAAVRRAQEEDALPQVSLPEVLVERPQRPGHGDYATSLPLRLARAMRMTPLQIAEAISSRIQLSGAIGRVEIAAPGFINFSLQESWLAQQVGDILALGERYIALDMGHGDTLQLEYVSANPVGPLHIGNGRWAAIGSALANVLAAVGYKVDQEYYVNDMGSQIETFAATVYARYQQLFGRDVSIPDDGYPGDYVIELAQTIKARHGEAFLAREGEAPPQALRDMALEMMLESIRSDLAALGVDYDTWLRESSLHEPGGPYDTAMRMLHDRGYVAEKEGAVWFTSTALGEDKDNVLVRSNGSPTYFASDIAYHYHKFLARGFRRVIDIWGADHQGHVPRMKAAVSALGVEPEHFQVIIGQLVTLKRGGEIVRISKRSGDILTLREVVDEVGADACRYFFLSTSPDTAMDFDLELAKRQSAENPVYYVQYAHARIASILALAEERAIPWAGADVSLLTHPAELALIRKMTELPEMVELVARTLQPHHLPHYALELATAFHDFYEKCRVVSSNADELATSRARLKLIAAAKAVLATTLGIMGMAAPDRM